MINTFNTLVEKGARIFSTLVEKAFHENDENCFNMCIKAYNTYQENEKDGVDYLFDLRNANDIITCLNGGLTTKELFALANSYKNYNISSMFMFGCNHPKPFLLVKCLLEGHLKTYDEEIVENMLLYPHSYDREFYYKIFTENLVD